MGFEENCKNQEERKNIFILFVFVKLFNIIYLFYHCAYPIVIPVSHDLKINNALRKNSKKFIVENRRIKKKYPVTFFCFFFLSVIGLAQPNIKILKSNHNHLPRSRSSHKIISNKIMMHDGSPHKDQLDGSKMST